MVTHYQADSVRTWPETIARHPERVRSWGGLTLTEAEEWLDYMSLCGFVGMEVRCEEDGLFAVRWSRPEMLPFNARTSR